MNSNPERRFFDYYRAWGCDATDNKLIMGFTDYKFLEDMRDWENNGWIIFTYCRLTKFKKSFVRISPLEYRLYVTEKGINAFLIDAL